VTLPDGERMPSQHMNSRYRLRISGVIPLDNKHFMHLLQHSVSENPWPIISSLEKNNFEFQVMTKVVRRVGSRQHNTYSAVRAAVARSPGHSKLRAFL